MLPLHHVVNSGSFLWVFSLLICFRSTSGLSQEANFHFRGPKLFKIGILLEGLRRLMSYKLTLHVLITFTEQVVPVHKDTTVLYSELPQ